LYELKDESTVHILMTQFFEYRMSEKMSVGQHVAKVEEMAKRLEDLGHKQDESFVITKILHSLPKSFAHLISAWDLTPKSERTLANLLPRLQKTEILNRSMAGLPIDSDEENESAALVCKRAGGVSSCHSCGSKKRCKVDD